LLAQNDHGKGKRHLPNIIIHQSGLGRHIIRV
jgi:hypothetical protein